MWAKCDYCGEVYYPTYSNYNIGRRRFDKDCCSKQECKTAKILESKLSKYGTYSTLDIANICKFKVGRNLKYTISDLENILLNKDLTLLTDLIKTNEISSTTKVPYRCNKHEDSIQYTTLDRCLRQKYICKYCSDSWSAKNRRKYSIEDAINLCNSKDYSIVTKNILTVDDEIQFICNKHKEYGIQTTSLYGLQHSDNNCKLCWQPKGDVHSNWRGGITKERDKIKHSTEYINWRRLVFSRDNFICQCCGQTGVYLNAHHIKNFSEYPELRFDVSNGITLCEKCHSVSNKGSFHSVYGTKNNTKEQLDQYISDCRSCSKNVT